MALTEAQTVNVRRWAGYPLSGTTQPVTDDNDTVYMSFGMVVMSLHRRLITLTEAEEAALGTYLTTLSALEAAIPAAGDNLDTASAAVWTRNANEIGDRTALFNQWRREMCAFLGLPPGPGLSAGNGLRIVRG